MNKVTAATVFITAQGTRLSTVYAEIDAEGNIVRDNLRRDRILTDRNAQDTAERLLYYAQCYIDGVTPEEE